LEITALARWISLQGPSNAGRYTEQPVMLNRLSAAVLRHLLNVGLLIAVPLAFATCTLEQAPVSADLEAKSMRPAGERALVYVYREDGDQASSSLVSHFFAGKHFQFIDNRTTNDFELANNTYYLFDTPAGHFRLVGMDYEKSGAGCAESESFEEGAYVSLDLRPDNIYVVRQTVRGWLIFTLVYNAQGQELTFAEVKGGQPEAILTTSRLLQLVPCESDPNSGEIVCYHRQPRPVSAG
jgi:hypothetical protein